MRQSTLLVVSFFISFPIVYFGREAAWSFGYGPQYFRQTGTAVFAGVVLAPILALLLTPLNKKLLAWRKERGRDIEQEERYESESGMIQLRPNNDD